MSPEYRPAAGLIVLIVALFIEQILWDGRSMETPSENTVSAFEIEEEGLSVALTNAIEDQREVYRYLDRGVWMGREARDRAQKNGRIGVAHELNKQIKAGDEMRFRAMRVLGLLEATREREAGQVT